MTILINQIAWSEIQLITLLLEDVQIMPFIKSDYMGKMVENNKEDFELRKIFSSCFNFLRGK